jgi:hypothetical protein
MSRRQPPPPLPREGLAKYAYANVRALHYGDVAPRGSLEAAWWHRDWLLLRLALRTRDPAERMMLHALRAQEQRVQIEREQEAHEARARGRRDRQGQRKPTTELVCEAVAVLLERRRARRLPTAGEALREVVPLLLDEAAFKTITDRLRRRGVIVFSFDRSKDELGTFICWIGSKRKRGGVLQTIEVKRVQRIISDDLRRRRPPSG